MGKFPITSFLEFFTVLFPLGAGILFWNKSTRPMRLLTGLILFGFLCNLFLLLLALQSINNIFLLHLYTIVSYSLIALIFSYWHGSKIAKYMRYSIVLFIIFYFTLLGLGYEELRLPNKYSQTMENMFVAFISLYTLLKVFQGTTNNPVSEDERFWVSLGIFINFPGSIFVCVAIRDTITFNTWQIMSTLTILSYFLYLKGFLCLRK